MPEATTRDETLASYLRRALAESGIASQRELARLAGLDGSHVNRIFQGRTLRPEVETLERLAEALGKPAAELAALCGYAVPPSAPRLPTDARLAGLLADLEEVPELRAQLDALQPRSPDVARDIASLLATYLAAIKRNRPR